MSVTTEKISAAADKTREKIEESYKAIAAFLITFGPLLLAVLTDKDFAAALPDGALKALVVAGAPALVAAVVWVTKNRDSIPTAAKKLEEAQARVTVPPQ